MHYNGELKRQISRHFMAMIIVRLFLVRKTHQNAKTKIMERGYEDAY